MCGLFQPSLRLTFNAKNNRHLLSPFSRVDVACILCNKQGDNKSSYYSERHVPAPPPPLRRPTAKNRHKPLLYYSLNYLPLWAHRGRGIVTGDSLQSPVSPLHDNLECLRGNPSHWSLTRADVGWRICLLVRLKETSTRQSFFVFFFFLLLLLREDLRINCHSVSRSLSLLPSSWQKYEFHRHNCYVSRRLTIVTHTNVFGLFGHRPVR